MTYLEKEHSASEGLVFGGLLIRGWIASIKDYETVDHLRIRLDDVVGLF